MPSIPNLLFGLSAFLRHNTGHSLAEWLSGLGSFVALLAGLVGGWIALKSYVSNSAAVAHAHMHLMFQSFLEARDMFLAQRDKRPSSEFGGSALYFLEEVYAWTQVQERMVNRRTMRLLIGKRERARKIDIVEAWKSTIISQLIANREEVLPSMIGYPACYGLEFLSFAACHLCNPALRDIAASHRQAIARGHRRPLGALETAQRKDLLSEIPARSVT